MTERDRRDCQYLPRKKNLARPGVDKRSSPKYGLNSFKRFIKEHCWTVWVWGQGWTTRRRIEGSSCVLFAMGTAPSNEVRLVGCSLCQDSGTLDDE